MGAQPEVYQQPSLGGFEVFPIGPMSKGASGNSSRSDDGQDLVPQTGGIALSIVIVIGICFLVLNVCACAGVFYQRDRVRFKEMLIQRQYKLKSTNHDGEGPTSGAQAAAAGARETLLALHRVEEDFPELDGSANGMQSGLPHQASTSTMDPHTKVSQWMAQEITIERCPTPPINNRLAKPTAQDKLGGSDRYDSRGYDMEDPTSALFPLLTKSPNHQDIYGLLPVKEENSADAKQPITSGQSPDFINQVHNNGTFLKFGDLGHVGESSPPFADSASSAQTMSRSSTGRRKARSKSQLGSQRSITTKRDVAVGGDGDDDDEGNYRVAPDNGEDDRRRASALYGYGAMDTTIRRLNLPKVLPDLPHQDVPAEATAPSGVDLTGPKTSASNFVPSDQHSPIYTIPYAGLTTGVDSGERSTPISRNERHPRQTMESPPASTVPLSADTKKQLGKSRRKYTAGGGPGTSGGSSEAVLLSSPTSTIVKTNLPQTVVVAPHPRANRVAASSPTSGLLHQQQQPEPCLVIRPGPRQTCQSTSAASTAGGPAGVSGYDSATNDNETSYPSATADVILRRPRQQDASTNNPTRPANRNSRSWYAQYSQSFISQSIDQESDKNDNWDLFAISISFFWFFSPGLLIWKLDASDL